MVHVPLYRCLVNRLRRQAALHKGVTVHATVWERGIGGSGDRRGVRHLTVDTQNIGKADYAPTQVPFSLGGGGGPDDVARTKVPKLCQDRETPLGFPDDLLFLRKCTCSPCS